MSRVLEERLKADLSKLISVYIRTYRLSALAYSGSPVLPAEPLISEINEYADLIEANWFDIIRATAAGISKYCNLYEITPINGVDEFKTIYYLGRAIEKHLLTKNLVKIAQVHLYTMIGLMDEKLQSKGVSKPHLTEAMTQLIKLREFDRELGITGCYLIYKCSSTVLKHVQGGSNGI